MVEAGDAYVTFIVTGSSNDNDGAHVAVWLAPDSPIFDPPTLVGGAADLTIGAADSSLSGEIDMAWSATGELAGTAVIDALTVAAGDVEHSADRQSGNHKIVTEEVFQPLAVTGTLTVPGRAGPVVLSIDGSSGHAIDRSQFMNAPSSTVNSLNKVGMLQYWYVDGMTVGVLAESDKAISWLEVAVFLPDGTVLHGSDEDAVFSHRGIEADVALTPNNPGVYPTTGSASIRGEVSRGERERTVIREGDNRTNVTVQHYRANGVLSVALDDGTVLELDLSRGSGSFYGVAERSIDGGREG